MHGFDSSLSLEDNEKKIIEYLKLDDWEIRTSYILAQFEILKDILNDDGYKMLLQYYWSDLLYTDYPVLPWKFNRFFENYITDQYIKC